MDECIGILLKYFRKNLPRLKEQYSWKITDIVGFEYSNTSSYEGNVALKVFLHKKWHDADIVEKLNVAKFIVSTWGGIKRNGEKTMQEHTNNVANGFEKFPIKGIASYSKILSISDYNRYAIYDARVAACLNAVQINYGRKKHDELVPAIGVAFNYLPGRNNITGNTVNQVGFTQTPEFKEKKLHDHGWKKIHKDECYQVYLDALHICLKYLHEEDEYKEFNLYDLEMVLFSNAEVECQKAMDSINTIQR